MTLALTVVAAIVLAVCVLLGVAQQRSGAARQTVPNEERMPSFELDACVPIEWVLRVGPAESEALARRAVGELSDTTGLSFRYGGEVDSLEPPARASLDHPVILVAWASEAEDDGLVGTAVGHGGPEVAVVDGRNRFLGGRAVVEAEGRPPTFGPGDSAGAVLLHELGHAVGLDHSADPRDVMAAQLEAGRPAAYSPRDLRRLATVANRHSC